MSLGRAQGLGGTLGGMEELSTSAGIMEQRLKKKKNQKRKSQKITSGEALERSWGH